MKKNERMKNKVSINLQLYPYLLKQKVIRLKKKKKNPQMKIEETVRQRRKREILAFCP